MPEALSTEERDLLIELRTDMKTVKQDIREMKDQTSSRVSALESRMAAVERQQVYWKGSLTVLTLLFTTFAIYILEKL